MTAESVRKQFDLTGRTAIITGGAGFLGQRFAAALAEMGAVVVLFDLAAEAVRGAVSSLEEEGLEVSGQVVDITSREQCEAGVESVLHQHGAIDILVNGAALTAKGFMDRTAEFFAPIEEYREDLWEAALRVNLTGTFLITQAVGRVMRQQRRGVIINIASDVGVISPDQRIYQPDESQGYAGVAFNTPLSYSTTKAGIINFTRHLATYWAPFNIRVNALSPAGVYRQQDPLFVKQLSSRIPLGRLARADELMGPVVFLASDASSFMTGGNLIVDGGRTCW